MEDFTPDLALPTRPTFTVLVEYRDGDTERATFTDYKLAHEVADRFVEEMTAGFHPGVADVYVISSIPA